MAGVVAATTPMVSVIVPVRNDPDGITRCVEALLAQDYDPTLVEVIVVDNGSDSAVAELLPPHPRVRVLREDQPGSYRARNRGLAVAQGDVLAFTDGDCTPRADWLSVAVAALHGADRPDFVGGAVEMVYADGFPSTMPELYEAQHAFPQQAYVERSHFAVTANMVTRRASFDRWGLFDERLMSRGDFDWGTRVHRGGGTQRYVPDAVVRHPARATWGELLRKANRVAQGRCDLERSNGASGWEVGKLTVEQVRACIRTALGVWRRERPQGAVRKAKYLMAYWMVRLVFIRVMLRSAVRGGATPERVAAS